MIRILFLITLQTLCHETSDSRFECGSHGRFEYCIDDIPGCVIGCHCHPGYYFDTDTKICEHNTKLTQNYRRNYVSDSSRVQILTQADTEATETTSMAPNPVDAKIDEITKDADDLGDWLYNHFFRTIENQVINKTNGGEKLTRWNASPTFANKPFRRLRKFWKKSRRNKKKKPKQGNLKKKLLQITEDDSLFDSSSSETSDDSTDSSSGSSASRGASEPDSDTNKDHGHKKFVILSKKQKPQLPSFIFLPNIDTPFYPPIGLPPPPALPMYPILPVPPIGPFAVVTTVKPGQETDSSTNIITTTTPAVIVSSETTITSLATTTEASTIEITTESGQSTGKSLRSKGRSNQTKNKIKNELRKKLLQKLQPKLKVKTQPQAVDYIMDYQEPDFINIGIPKEKSALSHIPSNVMDENIPKDEVNFTYLTQLIHRPNAKASNFPPSRSMQINSSLEKANNYLGAETITMINTTPKFSTNEKPDDAFYANLGRQIASMIRKMDSEGQRLDIEIEKPNPKPSTLPLFFENIYSPRSYWERSVRSPINNYIKEMEHFKKSNENLFNLEKKVENEASKRFLSLQDLENIISTMETAKSKLSQSNIENSIPTSNNSLNFNLLHHNNDYDMIKNTRKSTKDLLIENSNPKHLPYRRFHDDSDILFSKFVKGISKPENTTTATKKTITRIDRRQNDVKMTRKLISIQHKIPKSHFHSSSTSVLSEKDGSMTQASIFKPKTLKPMLKYHWNPAAGRLNFHYYFGDNNQYEYEKTLYPVVLPNMRRSYKYVGKPATPSYFHHELHHFDYFE